MMNCSEVLDLISLSIDGMLTDAQDQPLQEHLASCPSCRAAYDDMLAISRGTGGLPWVSMDAGFHNEIMRAVRVDAATAAWHISDDIAGAPPAKNHAGNHSGTPKRNYRRLIYGGAAACAAVVAMLVLPMAFRGSGPAALKQSDQAEYEMAAEATSENFEAPPEEPMMDIAPRAAMEFAAEDMAAETADAGGAAASGKLDTSGLIENASPGENLKIIKTANYNLEVDDFDATVTKLQQLATEKGGYIESYNHYVYRSVSQEALTKDLREGYISMKIPAAQYPAAKSGIESLGKVVNTDEYVENVTNSYMDVSARLDVKKAEEQRLLELLGKAEKIDDLIALESRLTLVRSDIESMTAQLKNWDRNVSYSTLNISLKEVYNYKKPSSDGQTLSEKLGEAFHKSVNSFVYAVQALVLWLAENFIWILILLILAFPVRKAIVKRFL